MPTFLAPATMITPYGTGSGRLWQADPGARLDELNPNEIVADLAAAGFLLFRGFHPSLDVFSTFVKRLSRNVTLDPARAFHGGDVAQKVDAGTGAVGLHLENGNSPFAPELTWFFCAKAARRGSQTTVCDGHRVWETMSPGARETFRARDILYTRRVEEAKWKTFVLHQLARAKTVDEITLDDLLALTDASTVIEPQPDDSVLYAYRTAAVHPTLFSDKLAWANSILGPSYNYEKPRITFVDGTALSADLLAEIERTTRRLTENLDWMDGDVALIDNTRVMHGRRAIEDTDRTIYNALSHIKRELM